MQTPSVSIVVGYGTPSLHHNAAYDYINAIHTLSKTLKHKLKNEKSFSIYIHIIDEKCSALDTFHQDLLIVSIRVGD